jgi:glutamate N-acetyltransferase/amino-acid N-acetyltransferase
VTGAVCEASARQLARTVCESPLINTAIAGGENNWGRIAPAIARAGEPIRHDLLSIRFGQIWAVRDGAVAAGYDEAALWAYMKRPEIEIAIDTGAGHAAAILWTGDLTEQYIPINARYRS